MGSVLLTCRPSGPAGYYRKGSALAGLKRYVDAEKAFTQVLKLDPNCEDAYPGTGLTLNVCGNGWFGSRKWGFLQQSECLSGSTTTYNRLSIQCCLAWPVGTPATNRSTTDDTTDGDSTTTSRDTTDQVTVPQAVGTPLKATVPQPVGMSRPVGPQRCKSSQPQPHPQKPPQVTDIKMDPSNPEGLLSVWVGQVMPEVTKKKLVQMFSKYGEVTSVYRVPHRCCAFVNFATREGAGKAMAALQDSECAGKRLIIRFPDNPTDGQDANMENYRQCHKKVSSAGTTVRWQCWYQCQMAVLVPLSDGSAGTTVRWQCWYHCQMSVLVPLSDGSAGTNVRWQCRYHCQMAVPVPMSDGSAGITVRSQCRYLCQIAVPVPMSDSSAKYHCQMAVPIPLSNGSACANVRWQCQYHCQMAVPVSLSDSNACIDGSASTTVRWQCLYHCQIAVPVPLSEAVPVPLSDGSASTSVR
ncbi:hypothetical protein LSAT2_013988 [Lamellibrachia satsuma]|nr:hypothetical protein LSAT2_013988 [Lamellibrachia satsuma]